MKNLVNYELRTFLLLCLIANVAHATRVVDEHRPADPATQLELKVVSGKIAVLGWNKPEIAVSGTLGDDVERLEVSSVGNRSVVRLHTKSRWPRWGKEGTALTIRMPEAGALDAQVTSADVSVDGIKGHQRLQSVSGTVKVKALEELNVRSVSGDIRVTVSGTGYPVVLSTISGDATISGSGTKSLSFESISGNLRLDETQLDRLRLKTVSGDVRGFMKLTAGGQIDAETISGDLNLHFSAGLPSADYELSTVAGDLSMCDGSEEGAGRHAPGHHWKFREGNADGRVQIKTKSGDVTLCGH
jgi:DUF4097 and DUF4098 domain-containing protein YvlB